MRIKAAASLEKLKKMKTKKRRAKSFSEVDPETWVQVKYSRGFGIGYIKIVDWVNKNTTGFHARADESFWFENEKDAFKFKLKWGKVDGEEY